MKRLLLTAGLGLVAAAFVFWIGWIQLLIPDAHYAVVYSKLGGWQSSVLSPGRFSWYWGRLLPTNVRLHFYPFTTTVEDFQVSGELPSADLFKEAAGIQADFSYHLLFRIQWQVRPEHLLVLARDQGVLPEGYPDWLEATRTQVRVYLDSFSQKGTDIRDPEILGRVVADGLGEKFPYLDLGGVGILESKLPDYELYQRIRELYLSAIEEGKGALIQRNQARAARTQETDERLKLLERYGELLTKYPILIELLKVVGNGGGVFF